MPRAICRRPDPLKVAKRLRTVEDMVEDGKMLECMSSPCRPKATQNQSSNSPLVEWRKSYAEGRAASADLLRSAAASRPTQSDVPWEVSMLCPRRERLRGRRQPRAVISDDSEEVPALRAANPRAPSGPRGWARPSNPRETRPVAREMRVEIWADLADGRYRRNIRISISAAGSDSADVACISRVVRSVARSRQNNLT